MSACPDAIAAEWPFVLMVVRRRLPTADYAFVEDVASAVIEKALRRADRYQERAGSTLRGWLTRLAQTTTIDALRTARYRQCDRLGEFGRVTTDAGNDRHALHIDLQAALATLPEQQRAYFARRMADQTAGLACVDIGIARTDGGLAHRFYTAAHRALADALGVAS